MRAKPRNEDGQTLVIVVLFMIILLGFCALVIDVGHAYLAQRRLQSSVDAAALAGADALPNIANAHVVAGQYGNGGNNTPTGVDSVQMNVSTKCLSWIPGCTTANAVTVKETGTINTVFGGLFGITSFKVDASATACSPCGSKPLDIMLLLDRTGSMCAPDCTALNDAKDAMKTFLGFMDPSLDHVGLAVLPPAPAGGDICKAGPYKTPTDPYVIVPLSSDYSVNGVLNPSSALVQTIGCITGSGTTSYANALEAAQAELVNDGRPDTQKVIVFMSDGAANTGPTSYPNASPYRSTPCHQGITSAAAIKGANTLVYSIGYGVDVNAQAKTCQSYDGSPESPTIDAKDALTDIASSGNYYSTPDSSQLASIYSAIAIDLLQGTSRLIDDNS